MKAFIDSLRIGPEKNFTYMIMCPETFETALIDPAFECQRVAQWVQKNSHNQAKMKYLLATHGHWDHSGGMNEMLKFFPEAYVTAHQNEEKRLKEQGIDQKIKTTDGQKLKLGNSEITCLHTPGHTEGGCSYLIDDQLFTGDTLFIGQCGRTDLSGGSDADLFKSLQKLKHLDGNLIVRPGHDYGPKPYDKLSEEIKTNPTLRARSLEEFSSLP